MIWISAWASVGLMRNFGKFWSCFTKPLRMLSAAFTSPLLSNFSAASICLMITFLTPFWIERVLTTCFNALRDACGSGPSEELRVTSVVPSPCTSSERLPVVSTVCVVRDTLGYNVYTKKRLTNGMSRFQNPPWALSYERYHDNK